MLMEAAHAVFYVEDGLGHRKSEMDFQLYKSAANLGLKLSRAAELLTEVQWAPDAAEGSAPTLQCDRSCRKWQPRS